MEYKVLKDIARITMGQSPESSSYNDEKDGMPFFQGNADFGELYPNERVWCNAPKKVANAGDILISVRAPIGALNYAKDRCCIGRGLAAITIEDEAERNYVFHLLKAKKDDLNNKGTGSTFKAIGKSVLEEISVPQISREEQEKCMNMMDLLESIIRGRQSQLDKLDELTKARFIELFGNPDINEQEWEICKLEELCDVGSSKRIYQNEQSLTGIPFLRIADLVNRMDNGTLECDLFIPETRYVELKEHGLVPQSGDILLTARGTLGRCYVVKEDDEFYFQDGMITWLSHYDGRVTPLYISYLFEMPGFRKQIDVLQAGSTVAYLSIAMTKNLDVMVPSIDKQNQFAKFVKQVDRSKVAVQKALDEAQTLFNSLMQEYFG